MSVAENDRGLEDRRLASAIRAGDDGAFLTLFRAYYEALCRYVYRLVESRSAAEDIVGEVFLRIWLRRTRWDPHGNVRAYLYSSARNRSLDHIRRRNVEKRVLQTMTHDCGRASVTSGAPPDDPEELLVSLELSATLQRAIDELPRRPREVLLLKWQRHLTNAQVAAELGIALKTVEMHVARAYEELRRRLPEGLK